MEKDLFDYWTTWIILAVLFYYFMIRPFFRNSCIKWEYRDDMQWALILWIIAVIVFLYKIGF